MVNPIKKCCAAYILSSVLVFTAMPYMASAQAGDGIQATLPTDEFEDRSTSFASLEDDLTEFVTRFYLECLDREPDQEGLAGWVNGLRNGWITGGELAEGFFLGTEFLSRDAPDETFLTMLYRALFDRHPDLEGFSGWFSAMACGMSRANVLEGFIHSKEFSSTCGRYDIGPYRMGMVEPFVTRFYRLCLKREPDPTGLAGWVTALREGLITGGNVAEGFILSPEFSSQGFSNIEFILLLYKVLLDRPPESLGLYGWLSALEQGMNRAAVLKEFIETFEFFAMCNKYGIDAVDEKNIDFDNDGYTPNQGDCEDGNRWIHPGAEEICGDGIDDDCDGSDLPCPIDSLTQRPSQFPRRGFPGGDRNSPPGSTGRPHYAPSRGAA